MTPNPNQIFPHVREQDIAQEKLQNFTFGISLINETLPLSKCLLKQILSSQGSEH